MLSVSGASVAWSPWAAGAGVGAGMRGVVMAWALVGLVGRVGVMVVWIGVGASVVVDVAALVVWSVRRVAVGVGAGGAGLAAAACVVTVPGWAEAVGAGAGMGPGVAVAAAAVMALRLSGFHCTLFLRSCACDRSAWVCTIRPVW